MTNTAGNLFAKRKNLFLVILILLTAGTVAHVDAQTEQRVRRRFAQQARTVVQSTDAGKVIDIDGTQVLIPNVRVFDHEGRQVRFYSDLIKNKVVLLSFFFTSCGTVCPTQAGKLARLQSRLGERLGKDVFLISVSMNPVVDTPGKLRSWSKALGARPGWTFVSSTAAGMNTMLRAFTGNGPGPKEGHGSLVFLGNDKTGEWFSVEGLSETDELAQLLIGLVSRF